MKAYRTIDPFGNGTGRRPHPEPYFAYVERRRAALAESLDPVLLSGGADVLEIGCGHGHFLAAYAASHPGHYCCGIDIERNRILRARRKQARAGLENLRFYRAEAYDFLSVLPLKTRFRTVFVLFPDPWPKRRHHKNRLIGTEFLNRIAGRCAVGAALFFRTDHEDYFNAACKAVDDCVGWKRCDPPDWRWDTESVFQQKAEHYFTLEARRRADGPDPSS